MKIGKLIAFLGILAMTAALVYGFTIGDFGADGALILGQSLGHRIFGRSVYRIRPVFHVDLLSEKATWC
jgi:hypothetical protein